MIDWSTTKAAVWRPYTERLRAVKYYDDITLDDLLGIERQKQRLLENTERFLNQQPCNHVLLWGSRGTGKSSIIKALLNHYADSGLRLLEVEKEDLFILPEIVDEIREQPYRFILFCDDLSFEEGEKGYKHLKSVMEGSIELPPENVRIYATSNRRHLLPETHQDNAGGGVKGGELHLGDALEEKISLADRFGLKLSFYPINQKQYFAMVDKLFPEVENREELHVLAQRFATEKGGRSARAARQFWNQYVGTL